MENKNYIDQLNEERIEKINNKIAILTKDLRNAKIAYNKTQENEEADIEKQMLNKNKSELFNVQRHINFNIIKKEDNIRNIDNELTNLKQRKKDLT
jgi:type II secretory pathway component PulJ